MTGSVAAHQLWRAVDAEFIRSGGRRGAFVLAAVPGAIVLPLAVTLVVALVSERFASLSGTISVTAVATTNSVFWVIEFTAMVWALIAAVAEATNSRGDQRDRHRYLFPRTWTGPLARWLTHGACAAVTSAALVVAIMLILPAGFPRVYGGVDLWTADGARLVVAVPLDAFLACGIGVGVGALIAHPAVAATVVLGWTYVIENAVALIPHGGYTAQRFMPFLNGQFATGQDLAFTPPWGTNGAMLYYAAITIGVFVAGCGAQVWRRTTR
ncbi:ABC transporter permease [Gordonia sp. NPDC003376]